MNQLKFIDVIFNNDYFTSGFSGIRQKFEEEAAMLKRSPSDRQNFNQI